MADPVFDESCVIALLQSTARPENVARLQTGAVQALVDLYDRKATREEFINNAGTCIALYGQVSKLWMLDNIEAANADGVLDKNCFETARRGLEDLIRHQSERVVEIVRRLQQCPTSTDPIN